MYKLSFSLCIAFCFFSCRGFYTAPTYNVPFHQKKNELKVNAEIGNRLPGFSASYSVSNSLYTFVNAGVDASEDQSFDFGIGYYKKIKKYTLDLSAGPGAGHIDIGAADGPKSVRFNFQGAFGIINERFERGLILRTMYVDYKWLNQNQYPTEPKYIIFHKPGYASNLMFEPAFFLKAGGKKLKFVFMAGTSIPLFIPPPRPYNGDYNYGPRTLTPLPILQLGLQYTFKSNNN